MKNKIENQVAKVYTSKTERFEGEEVLITSQKLEHRRFYFKNDFSSKYFKIEFNDCTSTNLYDIKLFKL